MTVSRDPKIAKDSSRITGNYKRSLWRTFRIISGYTLCPLRFGSYSYFPPLFSILLWFAFCFLYFCLFIYCSSIDKIMFFCLHFKLVLLGFLFIMYSIALLSFLSSLFSLLFTSFWLLFIFSFILSVSETLNSNVKIEHWIFSILTRSFIHFGLLFKKDSFPIIFYKFCGNFNFIGIAAKRKVFLFTCYCYNCYY